MIRKLVSIPVSDIVIRPDMITETAKKELSFISESLKEKSELFFITVVLNNKKYILVDRYDVYLAAIQSKIKDIPTLIVSTKNDYMQMHFQITMKSVLNPVKIINSMRPYVEEFGLDEATRKLHLHSDFVQMYELGLDQKILDKLNDIISGLCGTGLRTSVPLALFIFASKVGEKQLPIFIESLGNMVKESDRHFRWPHNVFLRRLEMGKNIVSEKVPERKLQVPDIEFCCQKCDTQYVVTDGMVNKREELEEGIVIQHKNDSVPRLQIPTELVVHLGVTVKRPPKIISSADITPQQVSSHLNGRKFLVILGEKLGQ